MKDLENHLVVGNTDHDLDHFYGKGLAEEEPRESNEDLRPLCQREQMCDGCGQCDGMRSKV